MSKEQWIEWQREFFALAACWLYIRWVCVDPDVRMPPGFDKIGTQIGELDQQAEMWRMVKEAKSASSGLNGAR